MDIENQIKMGKWKHKKTGKFYIVIGMVINTTNSVDGQLMVVYRRSDDTYVKEFKKKFEKVEGK